jgi:hypothetical protein
MAPPTSSAGCADDAEGFRDGYPEYDSGSARAWWRWSYRSQRYRCGSGEGGSLTPTPTPPEATLTLTLMTPNAGDEAILFTIAGPSILGVTARSGLEMTETGSSPGTGR